MLARLLRDRASQFELGTIAANDGREQNLLPIRHARMLTSPFAFLRGSACFLAAIFTRLR